MAFYLAQSLANHRRGRFFTSLIAAQPLGADLPHQGCVLMQGKDFQHLASDAKQQWREWAQTSGRTLLLLPPYSVGAIDDDLDWQVTFTEQPSSLEGQLTQLLAPEVTQELLARQGVSDRNSGHYWGKAAFNTRYVKKHAASGVFAATCLPIWSISLLDEAELLLDWLAFFELQAGTPSDAEPEAEQKQVQLQGTDYSILACVYAWAVTSPDTLMAYQSRQSFPVFQFLPSEVETGFERLLSGGYVDTNGLTSSGLEALSESAYWVYAEQLKEPSA